MPAPNLLVHCDGANGSTSFTDSSTNGFTLTANAGAAVTTATSVFGGASLRLGGSADRVTIPSHADFNVGSGDFTVEARIRPTVRDGNLRPFILQAQNIANNSNRSWGAGHTSTSIQFYFTTDGVSDQNKNFLCDVPLNAWSHVRFCRASGVLYAFLDGSLVGSTALSSTIFSSTADVCIGTFGKYAEDGFSQLSFNGDIDEIAYWKGTALSTASFTPPAGAYNQDGTVGGGIPDVVAEISTGQAQSTSATNVMWATISTGQANQSSHVTNLIEAAISTGQAQSSLVLTEARANFAAATGQTDQSSSIVAVMSYPAVFSTGQAGQSTSAGIGSATLVSFSSSQAQSASVIGVVANPISVSISSGQSNQSFSAGLAPLITATISSSQSNQSASGVLLMSYLALDSVRNPKFTAFMDPRSVKWIMPKRDRRLGKKK